MSEFYQQQPILPVASWENQSYSVVTGAMGYSERLMTALAISDIKDLEKSCPGSGVNCSPEPSFNDGMFNAKTCYCCMKQKLVLF